MKLTIKTLAVTALMSTASTVAFADAHASTDMTCEEYNQLGGAMRDKVAMMAVMELNENAMPTEGTATATDDSVGESATESEETASVEGSATATSIAPADDDLARFSEEIAVLNRTCSRNWDATVIQAAAGQSGTR